MNPAALSERIAAVRAEIEAACRRGGRDPADVTLVAVTKGHGAEVARAAAGAGLLDLGENRIEELEAKRDALRDAATQAGGVRWHHLGTVQSNKARRIAEAADVVHGLVPGRAAARLGAAGRARGRDVTVFLEVDLTTGAARQGVAPRDVPAALEALRGTDGLTLAGLMALAPLEAPGERARPFFARLRELRDRHAPDLPGLSMGMSGDFPVALEEGATIVRIGNALFGARAGT